MKNIFKKKKILIFSILILIGFFTASYALAAGISFFGGKITMVTKCTCNDDGGSAVIISGFPAIFGGTYLYVPGVTQARGNRNVSSGRQIIGQYSPGNDPCLVGVKPDCVPLSFPKGKMKLISTN